MTITIKKDLKLSTTDVSNSNILALTATYDFFFPSSSTRDRTRITTDLSAVSLFDSSAGRRAIDGVLVKSLPVSYYSVPFPRHWQALSTPSRDFLRYGSLLVSS